MKTLASPSDHFSKSKCMVSVVIPCYNQGQHIIETLDSVLAQTYRDIEIIIVNDGSNDQHTPPILKQINMESVHVIHTDNQGLAAARNNGINAAHGDFILPLDADDRIAPSYVAKAVEMLNANDALGIVYCQAELFDAVSTEWLLPSYSIEEMLLDNIIFCSAMFRKTDWETVGGYDPGMIYGWEDYDFWLSLIELGREVYQIPEILFYYRVASDSMVRSKERWQKAAMFNRIFKRHEKLFTDNIEVWINSLLEVREPYYTSKLYIDTGSGISDEECINRKVELGTSEIKFSLKDYKQIKSIRFDPIDTPAIIELFQIIVTNKLGERRGLVDYTDNSILQVWNERYFDTNDPQYHLYLTQSELESIDTLTVKLRFKMLAGDALQQIVKLQKDKLQLLSSKLGEYESAGIFRTIGTTLRKHEGEGGIEYLKRQLKLS